MSKVRNHSKEYPESSWTFRVSSRCFIQVLRSKRRAESWMLSTSHDSFPFLLDLCVRDILSSSDYDGPSISNGSPSPHINGSSTTQSIRSTRSDLSSQGNSTQVGVGIQPRADFLLAVGLKQTVLAFGPPHEGQHSKPLPPFAFCFLLISWRTMTVAGCRTRSPRWA